MTDRRASVRIELPDNLVMKLDRAPVRFVLTDCFKMAVAVGAGLTCGFCIAIGAILGIGRVVAWIAAKVLS